MKSTLIILSFLSSLFLGCNNCIPKYIYQPPDNMNDGLDVGTLERVGIDITMIARAVNKITCGKFDFLERAYPGRKDKTGH